MAGLAQAQEPLPPAAPAAAASRGALRRPNVSSLQAQIGELQAMVAALQSLVQQRPDVTLPQESAAAAPQAAGPDAAGLTSRVDALETQIGALSGQLEMMTQQLGALQAKLNAGGEDAPQPLAPGNEYQPEFSLAGSRVRPRRHGAGRAVEPELRVRRRGRPVQLLDLFGQRRGATAATSRQVGCAPPAQGGRTLPEASQSVAALPDGDPVSLYNQGYGDLLRRDYASAEMSFRKLLDRFPDDALAGKAQYWLGETYYVRGQFKDAAEAFLKSYKQYQAGEKAPDSLLEARHGARRARAEGCGLLDLERVRREISGRRFAIAGSGARRAHKAGC